MCWLLCLNIVPVSSRTVPGEGKDVCWSLYTEPISSKTGLSEIRSLNAYFFNEIWENSLLEKTLHQFLCEDSAHLSLLTKKKQDRHICGGCAESK